MVTDLYTRLRTLKVNINVLDGKLDVQAPKGVLNAELVQEIRLHKEELIHYITISRKKKDDYEEIPAAPVADSYPLSSSQDRLWMVSQFEEGNVAYNIPGAHLLQGQLDFEAFNASFQSLLERHENLRTVFRQNEEGGVEQYILQAKQTGFAINVQDIRQQPDQELWLQEAVMRDFSSPFNLADGPMLRASLYQCKDDEWVFTYVMHHIISDGVSMAILIKELLVLYNSYIENLPNPLAPLRIQYKDYAVWQRDQLSGDKLKQHRDYWLQQFDGELPVFNLPGDRPRPALKTFNGDTIFAVLDEDISKQVKDICQRNGSTLFMGLLAAVHVLFYRYTGQDDIIIGTPIAGRNHSNLEDQIGFYVNNLALRCRLKGEDDYQQLLEATKKLTLDSYAHQVYPFDSLIDDLDMQRDLSRSPLLDVMVVLQNAGLQYSGDESYGWLGDLKVMGYGGLKALPSSKYDLIVTFAEIGPRTQVAIEYNTDLYNRATIERMMLHLEQVIRSLMAYPTTPVKQLDYLREEEKQLLLETFNNTATAYPREASIGELFSRQAQLTPDKPALQFEGATLSYKELDELTNKLAHYLRTTYELQPDDLVGVLLDRSDKLIISLLAILKAGAGYVPLDADFPVSRKEFIVADTNIKLLITQTDYLFDIDFHTGPVFAIDVQTEYEESPADALEPTATANNLAYIMYTSGSTGTPKGVMVEHRSVVRLVKDTEFVQLTGNEVLLSTGAVSFDAVTFEYWGMLLNGGCLVMCRKEVLLDSAQMATIIKEQGVDMMWFTAGWLHQLVDEDIAAFNWLKTVLAGGDKLSPAHLAKLQAAYPELTIINGYGPTENTTFSLTYTLGKITDGTPIPVGKPISNSTAYVLDDALQLVPIGVVGEICVGGDGLARGYLNQPELTEKKFIPHPYKDDERLYRTGDLGRWTADGIMEFMGRRDTQVKIRGYRIEPGEIEAVLQNWPGVDGAIVIARTVQGEEKELIAYIAARDEVSLKDITNFVGLQLPAYMVPAHIVQLEQFPLTANGKVDRRQLPSPEDLDAPTGAEYVAPRNDTETRLVAIWQEVLGRDKVGVKDNFFELGGHSLKATRLASYIHREFEVKIGLKEIFNCLVLEEQAQLIDEAGKTDFESIPVAPEMESYPLSSSQKRLWVLSQFEDASKAYNMAGVYIFEGLLDMAAFEKSFHTLIERHESLRTVFKEDESGEVRQFINTVENSGFAIQHIDVRDKQKQEIVDAVAVEYNGTFDLLNGPLLRVSLFQTGDNQWMYVFVMHHIISDGWSMGILVKELLTFYYWYTTGRENTLEPLRIQYKDFSVWQQEQLSGKNLEQHRGYWLQQFAGELPVLELPTDKSRPVVTRYNGRTISGVITEPLNKALKELVQQQGGTMFMGLLAGISTFLYKYSGQDDIIIGSPIAGRNHADLSDQIGFYVNTLAFRCRVNNKLSFRDILKDTQKLTLDAYAHQVYPFDSLVDGLNLRRDLSRNPVFDVMVALQNAPIESEHQLDDLQVMPYTEGEASVSKFDLTFNCTEMAGQLLTQLEYNTDIFTRETAHRMLVHLGQLLQAMVDAPDTPIGELSYLTEAEEQQLLVLNNDFHVPLPDNKTAVDWVEEQAAKTPGVTALVHGDARLSFADFNSRVNQLAHWLRQKHNIQPEDLVAIQMDRHEKMVISLLAILKSGAAYMPVDPSYPQERINYMLQDSNAKLVLDEAAYAAFEQEAEQYSGDNPAKVTIPSHKAYVLYTSGSTGQPKAVVVEHGSLSALLDMCYSNFCKEAVVMPLMSANSFDVSIFEIFLPLMSGGTLHVLSSDQVKDVSTVAKVLVDENCNALFAVPSFMTQIAWHINNSGNARSYNNIKNIYTAGEAVTISLLHGLRAAFPQAALHNLYGPTEATVYVTWQVYPAGCDAALFNGPLLGHPIANTHVYILDKEGKLVPPGVVGELHAGGACVARGYLNRPELTAEKFIENPWVPGERIYKTGDAARWLVDGTIEFVGRIDDQVKIRGYRIELGEIEAALQLHELVSGAVVTTITNKDNDKELVAYITASEPLNSSVLRAHLSNTLPVYMVPGIYVQLESFPQTVSGKVDRKALPKPEGVGMETGVEYVAPRNPTEEKLLAIWQEILGREDISVKENFFEAGGHSLKATRLASLIHKEFNVKPGLHDLFVYPVLEDQARLIDSATTTQFAEIPAVAEAASYVLSSSQKRLWVLSQFEEANIAYNMPGVYVFDGALNAEALSLSFNELLQRHEILRTVFFMHENGDVRQVVKPLTQLGFQLQYTDLRQDADNEATVQRLLQKDIAAPFNLSEGPLVRAFVFQVADNRHVFYYVMHHIISDGWSMSILVNELLYLYNGHYNQQPVTLQPLRIQYKDYAAWQQQQLGSEGQGQHREYWFNRFNDEVPVLDLKGDYPRPALKTYQGKYIIHIIPAELANGIKQITRQQGGTLFMGLLAAVNTLLYRYTGQNDIVVGTPVAGREHADLGNQIGFYINTLALRMQTNAGDSFAQLLQQAKETMLGAYSHQIYPFDELAQELDLRRDMSRSPLFDVMMVLHNEDMDNSGGEPVSLENLQVSGYDQGDDMVCEFDLIFDFTEAENGIQLVLKYNTAIYKKETAERLAQHFERLLQAAVDSPVASVQQIAYLQPDEQQILLDEFSGHVTNYPKNASIGELFSKQAQLTPDKPALQFEGTRLSYKELDELTNKLAHYLRTTYELQPDNLVGILLDRSDKLIISLLAILKAGAGYVPLDADFPVSRKEFIAADTNIKLLITQTDYLFDIDFHTGPVFAIDVQAEYKESPADALESTATANNLAYIMYTSGSTGTPKGVMVEHRSVVRLVKDTEFVKITGNEVLLSTGAVSFDAVTFEYWSMLLNGGCLVMCRKEVLLDSAQMSSIIKEQGVDMMWFTAGWLHQLVDEDMAAFKGLKTVLAGGDKLSPAHLAKLQAAYPELTIINGYGPTENTTFSLTYTLGKITDGTPIPVGKPISNSTAYVLDDALQLVPIGVVGEICVGGDGLARGYLNQPELTEEKFIPHPYKDDERLYRTGDLGRWTADGIMEFMGRRDTQVKIRGYRIEPGEIEAVLQNWPGVDGAIVIARNMGSGDEKELVAYIAAKDEVSLKDVNNFVGLHLPAYMVPAHIVQLEQFPLTANGKVDRRQLPSPEDLDAPAGAEYVAPRNTTEEKLVAIWQEVLGRDKVGVKDNFFELGGHSLKATRLASYIHREFEVKIGLKEIFNCLVLEEQAQLIDEAGKTDFESIPVAPEMESYPMSSSQKRLWVLSQFEEANVAYNMPGVYIFEGAVDIAAFEKSFHALIERHESLRTVFKEDENGEIRQFINTPERSGFMLVMSDKTHLSQEEVQQQVLHNITQPFNLEQGPLLHAALHQTGDNQWIFVFVMHHIISDGWSMGNLVKELLDLYASFADGEESGLEPLRIQYKDYAVWQQEQLSGKNLEQHRGYWLQQFAGELPVLELPTDKPRPAIKTYNGDTVTGLFTPEASAGINRLTQEQGGTLFMTLVAGVSALLHKYSGQDDIIIGSPIAGRNHADLSDQIGFYVNTLALRCRPSGNETYRQLVDKTKKLTLDAYAHQVYPFDSLVDDLNPRRDMSRNALFDVMVSLQNTGTGTGTGAVIDEKEVEQAQGGFMIRPYISSEGAAVSKFDLLFTFGESPEGMYAVVEYNTDIFTRNTVHRMLVHLGQLLHVMVASPDEPIGQLNYLNDNERQQLLAINNNFDTPLPDNKTAVDRVEEQAVKTPDQTALVCGDARYSFAQFNDRVNQLAHWLRQKHNIQPEDLVAIQMDRHEKMVITILAILKSGAAYIPVDPSYPEERISYMLQDSGAKLVLDEALYASFEEQAEQYSDNNPVKVTIPSHKAYVLYTSGSTGKPKAVVVEHGSLSALLDMCQHTFCQKAVVMPLMSANSFDVSIFEIFLPLMSGGTLHVLSSDQVKDISTVAKILVDEHCNALFAVPSFMTQMAWHINNNGTADAYKGVEHIYTAGEAVTTSLLHSLRAAFPAAALHNLYGPTEATVYVTWQHYPAGCDAALFNGPLLGHPVANTHVYILDANGQLTPPGVTGELHAGGACVARGYLNREELTAERFIQNPWVPGERIYKTGDAARWLADGTIEFVGRIDDQVKIRGYRIELGEIEAALLTHELVSGAVVTAVVNRDDEKELVAYITASEPLNSSVLRAHLSNTLPAYMVPGIYVQLESFPQTVSGKIDRKALPKPEGAGMETGVEYVAPRNTVEEKLLAIWQQVLGREEISVKENFFEAGGHSLKATRLASLIHKEFNVKPGLHDLFVYPVLEDQARLITTAVTTEFANIPVAPQADSYPLSSSQKRLWVLSQFEESNVAYNMPGVYVFEGELSMAALQQSFEQLIARHEILRTTFKEDAAGTVRQYLQPADSTGFAFELHDLLDEPAREELVKLQVQEQLTRPFNLETGPLVRAALYRLAEDKWVFCYVMHHIISDAWSVDILAKELFTLYDSYANEADSPLPPLRIQYKDYAVWQQEQLDGDAMQLHRQYWLQQFAGELPVLQLPVDKQRPLTKTYNGHTIAMPLGTALSHALREAARQQGGTLFMSLLAALNGLLYAYTGQDDIIIGTPVAGRDHADLDDQIGFYVNTLALRCRSTGSDNFQQVLANTKQLMLDAFAHQAWPFDELVSELPLQRDTSRSPLFDIMMVLQQADAPANEAAANEAGRLQVKGFDTGATATVSKFDLLFTFTEAGEDIQLAIEYNTDTWNQATMERLLQHFAQLATTLVNQPTTTLDQLDWLAAAEKSVLTDTYNQTAVEYPRHATIANLFEEQVRKTPGRIALEYYNTQLTYRHLNEVANRLAHWLINNHDIQPGDVVGLQMERSHWLMTAILGTLKAGAVYLPLDPAYPADRLAYMAESSNCKLVITTLLLQEAEQQLVFCSTQNPSVHSTTESLAYIMFTSGSTGVPKGVMVPNRAVVRLVKSANYVTLTGNETLLATGAVSFDAATFEYWSMLLNGGRLVFCNNDLLLDAPQLAAEISRSKVTMMWFTAGWLHQLADEHLYVFQNLQTILAGGDKLSSTHIRKLKRAFPHLTIINGYGPTENTTFSLTHRIDEVGDNIPLGLPISNSTAYVLHRHLQPAPIGVAGEIYVGGDGLALGYLNDAALTAEKFIPHPFRQGERLYKTGDLGRRLPNGAIEFLGRVDDQVKINGYRVEPGEVEAALQNCRGVEASVVMVVNRPGSEKELAAYVTGANMPPVAELKQQLALHIPAYMVPAHIIHLPNLPLTPNGKVDRKQLSLPETVDSATGAGFTAPRNEAETNIARAWMEVLDRKTVSVTDNFFQLGGSSLKAIKLQALLRKNYGISVKMKDIFNRPTIEQMAAGSAESSHIVHLNGQAKHTKGNIFFIPPVLGNSILFKPLADRLAGLYNCIGLQYSGLEKGEAFFGSIQDAARQLYNEIAALQPQQQPFVIMGYSMGVPIAFETAKLLEAAGWQPKVVLADRGPLSEAALQDEALLAANVTALVSRYRSMLPGQHIDTAWLHSFLQNNLRILAGYNAAGTLKGKLVVVEAADNETATRMEQWASYTESGIQHIYVDGEHWDLLGAVNLNDFEKLLTATL